MTDFRRFRGDTYADEIIVTDLNDDPIDVTGYTFLQTVDPSPAPEDDTNNVFQVVGIIVDGPAGRVQFLPTVIQSDNVGNWFHDIQMVDGGGIIRTIDNGRYDIIQDITKD